MVHRINSLPKRFGEQNTPDIENEGVSFASSLPCHRHAIPFFFNQLPSNHFRGRTLSPNPKSKFCLIASTCLALLSLTSGIPTGRLLSRYLSIICASSLEFLFYLYFSWTCNLEGSLVWKSRRRKLVYCMYSIFPHWLKKFAVFVPVDGYTTGN